MKPLFWILLLLFCGAESSSGGNDWDQLKQQTPKTYVCHRTSESITIDGRLTDPAWAHADWTDDFVDIEGEAKPKLRFRTRAKMLWNERYFYIAAAMEEPHVTGWLTEHDAVIFQDNDFEIFIDPDGDNHEYYEIELNARNTVWDLFLEKPYKNGGSALNSWEIPGLQTSVFIEGALNDPRDIDRGWSVELAIPWKALAEYAHRSAPPDEGDQWRVNFSRVEWQYEIVDGNYLKKPGLREDNWVWSPQGLIDMHRPEKWGYVQFTLGKRGETAFTPDPTAPAREALHAIHYAQQQFSDTHARWASSLEELGLAEQTFARLERLPELQPILKGYRAIAELKLPSGKIQRWQIDHEARLQEHKP